MRCCYKQGLLILLAAGTFGCGSAVAPTSTGSVTGKIVLTGASNNAGATVLVAGAATTATTDATGSFTISGIPTGARTLFAFANGYEQGTESSIAVSKNGTATAPTLTLYPLDSYTPGVNPGGNPDGGTDGGVFQVEAALHGTATLLGRTDFSGTTVSVSGTSLTTTTATDGTWSIPNTPTGLLTLTFANGQYQATLPDVLSVPGSNGSIVDGTLWPLAPMDVPRGQYLSPGTLNYLSNTNSPLVITTYDDPVTGGGVIEVLNVSTGANFTLESGAGGAELSPDQQHVLYGVTNAEGVYVLKSVSLANQTPATLTSSEVGGYYTFGPDGSRIFYLVQDGANLDIDSVPIGGGSAVTLQTLDSGETNYYAFSAYAGLSADSSQIAICANNSLYITATNTAAGTARLSALTGGEDCFDPQFTPDGQTVVYGAYVGENETYYAVAASGSSAPVPLASGDLGGPYGFSPDGSYVALFLEQQDTMELVPVSGSGTPIVLSNEEAQGGGVVAFTADSAYAVYVDYDARALVRVDLSNGTSSQLLPSGLGNDDFQMTPDGETVLVWQNGHFLAINVATEAMVTLSNNSLENVSVSPDGTRVAFVTESEGISGQYLAIEPLTGATAAVPQFLTYDSGDYFWLDNSTLILERSETPAPYAALDGVYQVAVQQ